MKQALHFPTRRLVGYTRCGALLLALSGLAAKASAQSFALSTYAAGASPYGVAVGDVNNDGKLDAVTANAGANTLSVLLGNGAGGLALQATAPTTDATPQYVALADVNKDGKLDALTANGGANGLSVLLGDGMGGFTRQAGVPLTSAYIANIYSLGVGDVNSDGNLDIVIRNTGNTLGVLLGNGAGGFALQANSPALGVVDGSEFVTLTDLNGDGKLDVVARARASSVASILLGDGAGGFTLQANTPTLAGAANAWAVADVNGDGKPDLVAALSYPIGTGPSTTTGSKVSVLLGNGLGAFTLGNTYTVSTSDNPTGVALGDVSLDGKLDIIVTGVSNTVNVLLGNGAGSFSAPTSISTGASSYPSSPVVADLNKDGKPDVLAITGTTLSELLNITTAIDLVISTPGQTVAAGTYNSITVNSGGVGTLAGNVTVTTSTTVNSGGTLYDGCAIISGPGSFTLAAGGTLGICAAQGISSSGATGSIQNTGTRSFSTDASYVYNGAAAQVTGSGLPGTVRNLTTTNNSNVTLSQAAIVNQIVTVGGSGNLVLNNNALTLPSSASGTALVVNSGTGVVQGATGTMQRYIDASGNTGTSGYRHYSAPVSGATINSFSTSAYGGSFTAQVNPLYNTQNPTTLPAATYPNVFFFDESKFYLSPAATFTDFDKRYQSPQSLSDALSVGRGYAVQIGNQEKVQFTGTFNTGTQTISNLYYTQLSTATNTGTSAGWHLIGNPYPSPLDWGTVGASGTGSSSTVSSPIYVFQSTGAYSGRYTSFVNNVGAGTGLIAAGQAFFVRNSLPSSAGSITLTNANRVTTYGATPAFQRQAETRPLLRLSLGLGSQPATLATVQDETFVYFEQGATSGVDGRYDAYKLANPSGYYLSTASTDAQPTDLSIDGRAPLAAGTSLVVPVGLSVPAGTYTLTATSLLNFAGLNGGTGVYLRDALTGTLTDLATTPSYSFSVATNAPGTGRFTLLFGTVTPLATTSAALREVVASLYPNPSEASEVALTVTGLPADVRTLDATLTDALGRPVGLYTLSASQGTAHTNLPTQALASGLYLLQLAPHDAQGTSLGTLPTQRLSVR